MLCWQNTQPCCAVVIVGAWTVSVFPDSVPVKLPEPLQPSGVVVVKSPET